MSRDMAGENASETDDRTREGKIGLRFLGTGSLSADERDDLLLLIQSSVRVLTTADEILADYCRRIARVCVAYQGRRPVAFQFYQRLRVEDCTLLHFALTVKTPDLKGSGISRRMGRAIYLRCAPVLTPLRRFAVAALVDNPKSYANLLHLGGKVWPRLLPEASLSDATEHQPCLYKAIARRLAVPEIDLATGLVPRRVEQRGLDFREGAYDPDSQHPVNRAYAQYVSSPSRMGYLRWS